MEKHFATAELVQDYFRLFVNRRAYTVQSPRTHPSSSRYYYYRLTDAVAVHNGIKVFLCTTLSGQIELEMRCEARSESTRPTRNAISSMALITRSSPRWIT